MKVDRRRQPPQGRRISFSQLRVLHELDKELGKLEGLLFAKLDRITVFFLELQEDGS